jgi:pyrroline-5-carboxylate reductase
VSIDQTIGFVGAGNMAEALLRGLLSSGVPADHVGASDVRAERLAELTETHGIRTTADNSEVASHSQILVLSVKPQVMAAVLADIRDAVRDDALVISIAAGVATSTIEAGLGGEARVVRAMPNTPALVGAGATAVAAGAHATDDDLALASQIFDAVGMTVQLDEPKLDAVTGLSGSGPAYVFLILDALADAGVKVGLSREDAAALSVHTVLGAAKLAIETGEHPGRLKDMVTSPGGTTISGLQALERHGVRAALIDAVEAATQRSKELGRE